MEEQPQQRRPQQPPPPVYDSRNYPPDYTPPQWPENYQAPQYPQGNYPPQNNQQPVQQARPQQAPPQKNYGPGGMTPQQYQNQRQGPPQPHYQQQYPQQARPQQAPQEQNRPANPQNRPPQQPQRQQSNIPNRLNSGNYLEQEQLERQRMRGPLVAQKPKEVPKEKEEPKLDVLPLITKSVRDTILVHNAIIASYKSQKARNDKLMDKRQTDVINETRVPANRMLDWTQKVDSYIDQVLSAKVIDYEIMKEYEVFVKDLIAHNQRYNLTGMEIEFRKENTEFLLGKLTELEQKYSDMNDENIEKVKEKHLRLVELYNSLPDEFREDGEGICITCGEDNSEADNEDGYCNECWELIPVISKMLLGDQLEKKNEDIKKKVQDTISEVRDLPDDESEETSDEIEETPDEENEPEDSEEDTESSENASATSDETDENQEDETEDASASNEDDQEMESEEQEEVTPKSSFIRQKPQTIERKLTRVVQKPVEKVAAPAPPKFRPKQKTPMVAINDRDEITEGVETNYTIDPNAKNIPDDLEGLKMNHEEFKKYAQSIKTMREFEKKNNIIKNASKKVDTMGPEGFVTENTQLKDQPGSGPV